MLFDCFCAPGLRCSVICTSAAVCFSCVIYCSDWVDNSSANTPLCNLGGHLSNAHAFLRRLLQAPVGTDVNPVVGPAKKLGPCNLESAHIFLLQFVVSHQDSGLEAAKHLSYLITSVLCSTSMSWLRILLGLYASPSCRNQIHSRHARACLP